MSNDQATVLPKTLEQLHAECASLHARVAQLWQQLNDTLSKIHQLQESKLTIADPVALWMLWDPQSVDPNFVPVMSEGTLADMLGVDRVTLRTLYLDFLAAHGARDAWEVRMRQVIDLYPDTRAMVEAKIEERFQRSRVRPTPETPAAE